MSEGTKQFLFGCIGVAIVIFALLSGVALVMYNGQSQVCSSHGGHWHATDKPNVAGVDRIRECAR